MFSCDHKHHGTTTLFAALKVLNGAVLASCKPRHRPQEFLSFLREIDQAIRCGSFTGVEQPMQCIDHFVAAHNETCQPFKWSATADAILEKLSRLCSGISGAGH